MQDTARIVELLTSRICHDLVSPLGAIGNGLELMELTGGQTHGELELIQDSLVSATARIKYFRYAFGAAATGMVISYKDIAAIIDAVFGKGQLSVQFLAKEDQPRTHMRPILLLLQCLETLMQGRGEITVRKADHQWAITGRGPNVDRDNPMLGYLSGQDAQTEFLPSHIHFEIAKMALKDLGLSPIWDTGTGQIKVLVDLSCVPA